LPCRALARALVLAAALAGLAVAAGAGRLAAQETPLVRWAGPPGCATGAGFEAEVERILGRRPAGGPFGEVRVVERGGGLGGTLSLGGRARRIDAATCDALERAMALVLALHVDPDALSLGATVEAPEQPREPSPPEPAAWLAELDGSAVDPARARPEERDAPLGSPFAPEARDPSEPDARFLGGGGLALDLGAMPGLSPGVWIGAAARIGWIEIGLEGRFHPEQRATLAPRPQVGAEVTLLAGRVRLGAALRVARFDVVSLELVPLASLELGSVSARAVGLMTPLSGTSLWWALQAGLEARAFLLDFIGVFVRAELEVALRRSSFLVEGYSTPVFRAADAGLVVLVGLLLRTS
jgi:hypothetical protein